MPHDWPDVPNLVATAREFIESVTPRLDGQDRYQALCAIYLLEITERELRQWEPRDTEDDERLRALLGAGERVSREALAGDLSKAIAGGRFDDRLDALLEELIAHVRAKVAVSKPSFFDDAS